jgi:hypothetical protein
MFSIWLTVMAVVAGTTFAEFLIEVQEDLYLRAKRWLKDDRRLRETVLMIALIALLAIGFYLAAMNQMLVVAAFWINAFGLVVIFASVRLLSGVKRGWFSPFLPLLPGAIVNIASTLLFAPFWFYGITVQMSLGVCGFLLAIGFFLGAPVMRAFKERLDEKD